MGGSGDLQGLGTSQLYQTQKKKSHPSLNELTLKYTTKRATISKKNTEVSCILLIYKMMLDTQFNKWKR